MGWKADGPKINVLVVGAGRAAMEYIRSLICFPNYGCHLVGYLAREECSEAAKKDFADKVDDFIIGSCGILGGECGFNKYDNIPSDQVHCCGKYEDFERVLSPQGQNEEKTKIETRERIDDVIFCTDDIDDESLKDMLVIARQRGINCFFASKHNKFLPSN